MERAGMERDVHIQNLYLRQQERLRNFPKESLTSNFFFGSNKPSNRINHTTQKSSTAHIATHRIKSHTADSSQTLPCNFVLDTQIAPSAREPGERDGDL
jgi:hypothetical protein